MKFEENLAEIDEIIEEERCQHHEGRAPEARAVDKERNEHRERYHGIVGEIAQMEEFAP